MTIRDIYKQTKIDKEIRRKIYRIFTGRYRQTKQMEADKTDISNDKAIIEDRRIIHRYSEIRRKTETYRADRDEQGQTNTFTETQGVTRKRKNRYTLTSDVVK